MVLNEASADFDPHRYRRWYETSLGQRVDADEKEVVFALADLKPGERVLDIGCGDGNYTGPAAERTGSAIGLDRSPAMLKAAAERLGHVSGLEWVEGDAAALPFPDRSFDAALIVTVLCFARDPQAIVSEAFRVVRPGGRLILAELGRYSSWAFARRVRGLVGSATWRHAHFFSPRELRRLLRNAGFVGEGPRGAVFYPPVAPVRLLNVARRLERIGRRFCPQFGALLVLRGTRPS